MPITAVWIHPANLNAIKLVELDNLEKHKHGLCFKSDSRYIEAAACYHPDTLGIIKEKLQKIYKAQQELDQLKQKTLKEIAAYRIDTITDNLAKENKQ
jgi:hypothetical protein